MKDCQLPRSKVAPHIAALPKSGIRDFFEIVSTMDDVISLGVGEPDFPTPWHIREAAIYGLERGHTSYTSNLGLIELRQEITAMISKDFGMDYKPETECIVTVGVSEALDLVMRALLEPGDEVIYHQPCYVSYSPSIAMAHAKAVPVPTYEKNEFALDSKDLEAAITDKTKAILLNFPCNPTGADLTFAQKEEIAKIAIKYDLVVITDEIYAELTYEKRSNTIASIEGMAERTVFLHGFSKAYAMTGFRIGYACGPADIIDAMMKIHQYSMLCAPIGGQEAAIEALQNGEEAMLEMKEEYEQRRNLMVRRLNKIGLPCHKPNGAFYVFPNISSTGLSAMDFSKKLLYEKKVAAVPGTAFSSDPDAENYIRCSYATGFDELEIALERIGELVEEIKATNQF